MGDRANVRVTESGWGNEVFLYTHWGGYELPEVARQGLNNGRGRWTDSSYLARIIFCRMVKGREDGETGFGISSKVGDGDGRIVHIDCSEQKVTLTAWGRTKEYSFKEYVALDEASWPGSDEE